MKKIITLLFLIPFISFASSSTLWEYYNGKLPSISVRAGVYQSVGKDIYKGTVEQNTRLLNYLQSFGFLPPEEEAILGGSQNAVGGKLYFLSGSGISSSATSISLTKFEIAGGTQKLRIQDFGSLGCGTLEPGHSTRQEFVSFNGVTQNSDGTATLTGVLRGLSPVTPYSASTTLQSAHSGGSQFVLSNSPPCFYEGYANRTASTTISHRWIFDVYPEISIGNATTSNQLATKGYVDGVAIQGAATSTETVGGLVELGTLAEQVDSFDGGSDKPTVLQTKNSTSTCQIVGSYNLVASSTSGKLDKNCFDQSLQYSFTGSISSSASTTFSGSVTATTTFTSPVKISATSEKPLELNGQAYTFPASQNASSTVLQTDSLGKLYFMNPDWQFLGESSLDAAGLTLNFTASSSRKDLRAVIEIAGLSVADTALLDFNGDTGNNYGEKTVRDNVLISQSNTRGNIRIMGSEATTSPAYIILDILNIATRQKLVNFKTTVVSTGPVSPVIYSGAAVWNNTLAQITTLNLSSSQTFLAGTRISLYGSRE